MIKKIFDKLFEYLLAFFSFITFLIMICIFVFLIREALIIFEYQTGITNIFYSWDKFGILSFEWNPASKTPKYSIIPLVVNSFKVAFIALAFSIPIAFFTSIYTSQYVSLKVRFWIKTVLEFISSIPSVVLAFFGFVIFSEILGYIFSFEFKLNGFIAGITLGFGIFPSVYTIYEDFLYSIPKDYKEASYALGANKIQTIIKVIIPFSLQGLLVAVLLGFNRAIGETMIVMMLGGNIPILSYNLFDPVLTLSGTISGEMGEVIFGDIHYSILFILGIILFFITFLFNMLTLILMRSIKKRYNFI